MPPKGKPIKKEQKNTNNKKIKNENKKTGELKEKKMSETKKNLKEKDSMFVIGPNPDEFPAKYKS